MRIRMQAFYGLAALKGIPVSVDHSSEAFY